MAEPSVPELPELELSGSGYLKLQLSLPDQFGIRWLAHLTKQYISCSLNYQNDSDFFSNLIAVALTMLIVSLQDYIMTWGTISITLTDIWEAGRSWPGPVMHAHTSLNTKFIKGHD